MAPSHHKTRERERVADKIKNKIQLSVVSKKQTLLAKATSDL